MTALFAVNLLAWIISYIVIDNHIKSLENEIERLKEIIRIHKRNELTKLH